MILKKNEDHDKIKGFTVIETPHGTVQIGKTRSGAPIIVRYFSSDRSGNVPTIEILYGPGDVEILKYPNDKE